MQQGKNSRTGCHRQWNSDGPRKGGLYSELESPYYSPLYKEFIETVEYHKVQVLLDVLAEACADSCTFQWGFMEQHAFEEVKTYVVACILHSHKPLNYGTAHDLI